MLGQMISQGFIELNKSLSHGFVDKTAPNEGNQKACEIFFMDEFRLKIINLFKLKNMITCEYAGNAHFTYPAKLIWRVNFGYGYTKSISLGSW